MKLERFKELLGYLEVVRNQDISEKQARYKYFNAIYPDNYAPYKKWYLDEVIESIQYFNIELYRELVYYFFEAKNMEEATVGCETWEYDFTKESELIKYLLDNKIIIK